MNELPEKITASTPLTFEGQPTTFGALAERFTAYHPKWLRSALRDGDRSREDFSRRWAANKHRSYVGSKAGKAAMVRANATRFK